MPQSPIKRKLNTKPLARYTDYPALRKKIEETLLLGQRKIEEAKVQTYWQTGKFIHEHILRHESRTDHYGEQIIKRLSEDLKIDISVLWRCVRFARSFKKILVGRPQSFPKGLSWTHYRKLITIPDDETRFSFMRRAEKSGWSADELAQKIHQEIKDPIPEGNGHLSVSKLIPKKGKVYTYRLIAPDSVHKQEEERLWIDLGFQVHRQIPEGAGGFKEGSIIESQKRDGDYGISASNRKEADLFTYNAFVERVVDGDTLIVKIDLGFETRVRQYLRLRGIDAPELDTPEGKKARDFVVRELSRVPYIILTSSRSDKYDRYLADVFVPSLKAMDAPRPQGDDSGFTSNRIFQGKPDRATKGRAGVTADEQERYLNQVLLDEGLAERWE